MPNFKKENFFKSPGIIILIISLVISIGYLLFFHININKVTDIPLKNSRINTTRLVTKGEVFKVNTILWSQIFKSNYHYVLESKILNGDFSIESIEVYKNKNILSNNQKKTPPHFQNKKFVAKDKRGVLSFILKHQIYLPRLELTCVARKSGKLTLEIDQKLLKKGFNINIPFLILQFFALILAVFIGLKLIYGISSMIFSRSHSTISEKMSTFFSVLNVQQLLKLFLTLLFVFYLIFLLTYIDFFKEYIFKKINTLLIVNISLFLLIMIVFFLYRSGKKKGVFLFLFFILAAFNFKFIFELSGDAVLWEKYYSEHIIWHSETLSQLFNNTMADIFKFKNFNDVFLIGSKIIGSLFFVFLYLFNKELFDDANKRIFSFVILITSTYLIFFFGYPEYSYWVIPFQLISLLLLIKFLNTAEQKYLIWLAVSQGVGFSLHGSMIFIILACLILILVKFKGESHSRKQSERGERMGKSFGFAVKYLCVIFLIFVTSQVISLISGYEIIYQGSLVTFNPHSGFYRAQLIFFELDHLKLIGFIMFLTMPSFIFWFPFLIFKKKKNIDHSTGLILIFSLFQSIIILFWNFDYYIRDFDLLLSSTVFSSILIYRLIVDHFISGKKLSKKSNLIKQLIVIFFLSLTSGIGLIAIFTSKKFLFFMQAIK